MKLKDLRLCVQCNEVFTVLDRACPSCCSTSYIPLSSIVKTTRETPLDAAQRKAAERECDADPS